MQLINSFFDYVGENPIIAYGITIVAIVISVLLLIHNAKNN